MGVHYFRWLALTIKKLSALHFRSFESERGVTAISYLSISNSALQIHSFRNLFTLKHFKQSIRNAHKQRFQHSNMQRENDTGEFQEEDNIYDIIRPKARRGRPVL